LAACRKREDISGGVECRGEKQQTKSGKTSLEKRRETAHRGEKYRKIKDNVGTGRVASCEAKQPQKRRGKYVQRLQKLKKWKVRGGKRKKSFSLKGPKNKNPESWEESGRL